MRKLNLIIVFNKDLNEALFCIRAKQGRDLPVGPGVTTLPSSAKGEGLIPHQGANGPTCLGGKTPKHKTEAIQ